MNYCQRLSVLLFHEESETAPLDLSTDDYFFRFQGQISKNCSYKVSMNLSIQSSKLSRHQSFLEMDNVDRPLFGSSLFGFFVHTRYPRMAEGLEPGQIKPDDILIRNYLEDIDCLFEAYTDLDDDFPFSSGAFYGVPWLEAIMGCEVHFPGTNFYAKSMIEDWDAYKWEKPKLDNNPWLEKMLECLEAVVHHSRGRFQCGPTLMRGIADMVSAMRGGTNLAIDSIICPSNVKRLADICAEVWIETGKAQLDLVNTSENGYMVGVSALRVWFPEKGIWLQDDALSLLSPTLYQEIFLPYVKEITRSFPRVAFHLHGNVLWAVELFSGMDGIDVLELNYDKGSCKLEDVKAEWKKIQGQKPCIAFGQFSPKELQIILDELKPIGLSIQTVTDTAEEAQERRDLVNAITYEETH
jgi:hypothetical protein